MNTAIARLYDTDFYGWTRHQADSMRTRNLANLDFDNLIEEIESMGKSQQRALESRLEVLLMHLLKYCCKKTRVWVAPWGKSWQMPTKMPYLSHLKKPVSTNPPSRPAARGHSSRSWMLNSGLKCPEPRLSWAFGRILIIWATDGYGIVSAHAALHFPPRHACRS